MASHSPSPQRTPPRLQSNNARRTRNPRQGDRPETRHTVSPIGLAMRQTLSMKRAREEEEIRILQSKREKNEAQTALFNILRVKAELEMELLNRQLRE